MHMDASDIIWDSTLQTVGQLIAAIEHYALNRAYNMLDEQFNSRLLLVALPIDTFSADYLAAISTNKAQDFLLKLWAPRNGQVFITADKKLVMTPKITDFRTSRKAGVIWIPVHDDYLGIGGLLDRAGIGKYSINKVSDNAYEITKVDTGEVVGGTMVNALFGMIYNYHGLIDNLD